jgi:hypothetical protein
METEGQKVHEWLPGLGARARRDGDYCLTGAEFQWNDEKVLERSGGYGYTIIFCT